MNYLKYNNGSLVRPEVSSQDKCTSSKQPQQEQSQQNYPEWINEFNKKCLGICGTKCSENLDEIMELYIKEIKKEIEPCEKSPNRAAFIANRMSRMLLFFYFYYSDIKEFFVISQWHENISTLLTYYYTLEIKAVYRIHRKDSDSSVCTRLMNAFWIYLNNKYEDILYIILQNIHIGRKHKDVLDPIFRKLLVNRNHKSLTELEYIGYLLAFKLWKRLYPKEEKKNISQLALTELKAPISFLRNYKKYKFCPLINNRDDIHQQFVTGVVDLESALKEYLELYKNQKKIDFHSVEKQTFISEFCSSFDGIDNTTEDLSDTYVLDRVKNESDVQEIEDDDCIIIEDTVEPPPAPPPVVQRILPSLPAEVIDLTADEPEQIVLTVSNDDVPNWCKDLIKQSETSKIIPPPSPVVEKSPEEVKMETITPNKNAKEVTIPREDFKEVIAPSEVFLPVKAVTTVKETYKADFTSAKEEKKVFHKEVIISPMEVTHIKEVITPEIITPPKAVKLPREVIIPPKAVKLPREVISPPKVVKLPREVIIPSKEVITPFKTVKLPREVIIPSKEDITPIRETVVPKKDIVTPTQEINCRRKEFSPEDNSVGLTEITSTSHPADSSVFIPEESFPDKEIYLDNVEHVDSTSNINEEPVVKTFVVERTIEDGVVCSEVISELPHPEENSVPSVSNIDFEQFASQTNGLIISNIRGKSDNIVDTSRFVSESEFNSTENNNPEAQLLLDKESEGSISSQQEVDDYVSPAMEPLIGNDFASFFAGINSQVYEEFNKKSSPIGEVNKKRKIEEHAIKTYTKRPPKIDPVISNPEPVKEKEEERRVPRNGERVRFNTDIWESIYTGTLKLTPKECKLLMPNVIVKKDNPKFWIPDYERFTTPINTEEVVEELKYPFSLQQLYDTQSNAKKILERQDYIKTKKEEERPRARVIRRPVPAAVVTSEKKLPDVVLGTKRGPRKQATTEVVKKRKVGRRKTTRPPEESSPAPTPVEQIPETTPWRFSVS